jgi:hypothetical protein
LKKTWDQSRGSLRSNRLGTDIHLRLLLLPGLGGGVAPAATVGVDDVLLRFGTVNSFSTNASIRRNVRQNTTETGHFPSK